jgi:hypothetical protein
MAQRRIFRSLAATASLRRLATDLAHAKKPRSIPVRASDRTGDAGEAAIGAAVPQKALVSDSDVVGGALPFAHQNRPAARKRSRRHLGSIASEGLVKKPSQLLGHRFGEATLTAFLPRVGNAERENVTAKCSWRLLAKLLCPERTQLTTGLPIKVMDIDQVTTAIVNASLAT